MSLASGLSKDGVLLDERRRIIAQSWIKIAITSYFVWYSVYVLILAKFFSVSVMPPWYRDLGILWNLAAYTAQHGHYPVGTYFFPPSNAILFYLYGLIDHDIAFRLYLVIELAMVGITVWAWLRILDVEAHSNVAPIIFTAFLAAFVYIHFELGIHNANALCLGLISLGLATQRKTILSSGCYALSLAVKPYSSVLILPWMLWRGHYRWATAAACWLVLWFGVVPTCWFGLNETVQLYREWVTSVLMVAGNDNSQQVSVRSGVAALMDWQFFDPRVQSTALALQAVWIAAVLAYFLGSLRRRQSFCDGAAACELAAILLIGLPLGDHQQPAREIALLPSTLVISSAVFNAGLATRWRVALACILVVIGISSRVVPMGPLNFLLTLPLCLLALMGLAVVRETACKTA